ncbi:MAG: HD domain-containing protein [bacterium]
MEPISVAKLRQSTNCFEWRDLILAPPIQPLTKQFEALDQYLASPNLPPEVREIMRQRPGLTGSEFWLMIDVKFGGSNYSRKRRPAWFDSLPRSVLRSLAYSYRIDGGRREVATICAVPFSSLHYTIFEGGLIDAAVQAFRLGRLLMIGQLGFLQGPVGRSCHQVVYGEIFKHNRFEHVMNVAAIATLLARNLGLTRSQTDHLVLAAATHDALTPAGGDTTKALDFEAFDEDLHYPEILVGEEWEELRRRFRIDRGLLTQTVLGRGLLGGLLDISDKIGYSGSDFVNFLRRHMEAGGMLPEHAEIERLLSKHPTICDVWDTVRVVGDRVVYADPDRLGRFLKARALMFKSVYYGAETRCYDFVLGSVVMRYLYSHGKLTREWLLEATDRQLLALIQQALELDDLFLYGPMLGLEQITETYASLVEALEAERKWLGQGKQVCVIESIASFKIKPGLNLPVLTKPGGPIREFQEVRPRLTAELKEIARIQKPYRVYCLPDLVPSDVLIRVLKFHQRTRTLK